MIPEVLIATRNQGKVRELTDTFIGYSLLSLADTDCDFEVEETGTTYSENATLKAEQYGACADKLTIADDSGFEVLALNNAPGVYSARYTLGTDSDRSQKILEELETAKSEDRSARFVSVIAVYDPETQVTTLFEGIVEGSVSETQRGDNGFGYDPIFIPEGYTQTFAELDSAEKQRISHRARALEKAYAYIKKNYPSS